MTQKFILRIFFGILISILLGSIIGFYPTLVGEFPSEEKLSLYVTFFGGIGGLLFSIQTRKLKIPKMNARNSELDLGFVADVIAGMSGAFIIFLILPFDFDSANSQGGFENLKIIATSILGGYAGQGIFKAAFSKLSLEVEALQAQQEKTQVEVDRLSEVQKNDAEASDLIDRYVSNNIDLAELNKLINLITSKEISPALRTSLFHKVKDLRTGEWYRINDIANKYSSSPESIDDDNRLEAVEVHIIKQSRKLIEKTIPIFKALIESLENESQDEYGRIHAELAFAYKDSKRRDWSKAKEAIEKAISIRNNQGKKGYVVYEYNRALCNIKILSNEQKKGIIPSVEQLNSILGDLKLAADTKDFYERLNRNDHKISEIPDIKEWLSFNKLSLDEEGKSIANSSKESSTPTPSTPKF